MSLMKIGLDLCAISDINALHIKTFGCFILANFKTAVAVRDQLI